MTRIADRPGGTSIHHLSSAGRRPPRDGTLREREESLGEIAAHVERARNGEGGVLVFEGPPGIGKSRLMEAAVTAGEEAGMRVFTARPSELDDGFAFGVVRDLFEWPLRELDPRERAKVTAAAAGLSGSLLESAEGPRSADPLAMRHSLYWLAVNLAASRPLLICLDDAHWADRPSLEWLRYLVRRQGGTSIGIVLGTRPAEPGADLSALTELCAEPGVRVLRPAPLTREGVVGILAAELGEGTGTPLAEPCLELTAGNPLLLLELVSLLGEGQIEPTVDAVREAGGVARWQLGDITLARISRTDGAQEAVLKAVAVLGPGCRPGPIADLAATSVSEARDTVAELAGLDILAGDEEAVRFAHPLLATAVYRGLRSREREALHRGAAFTLIDAGAPPEEIAAHLIHTDPAGLRIFMTVLLDAAARAISAGDPPSAHPYLRRATEEVPLDRLPREEQVAFGRALLACGDPAGADLLRAMLAATTGSDARASLALELGSGLGAINRYREACVVLRDAVEDLDGDQREMELLLEAALYFSARTLISPDPSLLTRIERFGEDLRGETPGERTMLAVLGGHAIFTGASAGEASALLTRALREGPPGDDRERLWRGFVARMLVFCGELSAARELVDELLDEPRTQSSPLVAIRCFAAGRQGDIESALADGAVATDGIGSQGLRVQLGIVFGSYMEALIQAGRPAEALEVGARLEAIDDQREISGRVYFLHTRALALLATGDRPGAIADLREVSSTIALWGCDCPGALQWRATLAEALRLEGKEEEAARLAREEVAMARSFGSRRALGIALMALATTLEEPTQVLREAVDVLSLSDARLEHARARVRLGGALRRSNRRGEAREQLLAGLDLAARCPSPPVEREAREELAALGSRPRRSLLSGPRSLTASEARVAAMAADGMTNREIAQVLFVTIKTVETHLSRTYTKLGVTSRLELPAGLRGERLGSP